MPLFVTLPIFESTTLFVWKITEDYNTLFKQVVLKDTSLFRLERMKSESHQKGFLAVRMLLQHIGLSDYNLVYDETGKPNLMLEESPNTQISISHSFDFSAIVISDKNVGLDVEQIKEKNLKIAPRFMNIKHLEGLNEQEAMQKATVIWGIKETVFKLKNEKGISFPNHIFEEDFNLEEKKAQAKLCFKEKEEYFHFVFDFLENYVFVCGFEKK